MPHLRARQKGEKKRNGDSFKPMNGSSKKKSGNGGQKQRGGNKYAAFSQADFKQAQLAANGGSLIETMPAVQEQRERERYLSGRPRFW